MLKLSLPIANQLKKLQSFCITIIRAIPGFSETREINTPQTRDKNRDTATPTPAKPAPLGADNEDQVDNTANPAPSINDATLCPYCTSNNFVKRGKRQKKHETVQLYLCRDCHRTFTAQAVKGRRFPLTVILEAMTLYNLGYTLTEVSSLLRQKFSIQPEPSTISEWLAFYEPLCRYGRLRADIQKRCRREHLVEVTTMAHRQIYRFRYHRGKLNYLLQEEPKHRHLQPLRDYLESVSAETPHQYFQEGLRISEVRSKFDKTQMVVKGKHNFANRLAELVLPTVRNNQARHNAIQRFMLANDSVTVATEVPVYIRQEDIEHLENQLNFKVLGEEEIKVKVRKNQKPAVAGSGDVIQQALPGVVVCSSSIADPNYMSSEDSNNQNNRGPEGNRTPDIQTTTPDVSPDGPTADSLYHKRMLLTGHIDLLQVRNGVIHILDYKPQAARQKPIEQLTWYALALSRLTGLRLFSFKCAWFDEKEYFEFYPLHVVYKIKTKRRRKTVHYRSGERVAIPQEDTLTVVT